MTEDINASKEPIEPLEPTAEDSMSPPEEEQVILSSASHQVDDILCQVVNINSDNIFHEPTCLICSNTNRNDMEKKWIETKDHETVKNIFRGKSKINLSNDIIDNHMRFHYDRGIKEIHKIEYINRIKRLNSSEFTTLDRIRLGLAALMERLMGINSIVPNNDVSVVDIEQMKTSETTKIMGSFNQLLKLQASIMGEMKSNGELIIIPRQSFIDVFNTSIIESKTDQEKKTIQKILSRLSDINKKTQ